MPADLISDKKVSDAEMERLIDELDNTDMEDTDKMVMKELLRANEKDIFFKTDLKDSQINAIAKLLTINNIVNAQSASIEDYKEGEKQMGNVVVDMAGVLMKLLVSRDRKGRAEFIDAWKGSQENQRDGFNINKFLGKGV